MVSVYVSVHGDSMSDVEYDSMVTSVLGIIEVVAQTASPLLFSTAAAVIIRIVE